MLYATLSKFPTPIRSKPASTPENIINHQECNSIISKNISSYGNRGINKHGRKFVIKQQRSSQHQPKPLNKSRDTAYDSKWNRNDIERVNCTVHEQQKIKKGGKRHTYNYPYETSEREEDNQQKPSREDKTRAKRSCITSNSGNNYETQKKWIIAQSDHQRRGSTLKSQDLDEQHQFLQSKVQLHSRKASVLGKLTPLQLNNQRMAKPSLVELIKKFKFENLKTTQSHQREFYPLQDVSDHNKAPVSPVFFLKERREKTDQEDPLYAYRLTNRKINKTIAKNIAKDRKTEVIPYNNSILTPWATTGDNFSNTQNLIE